MKKNNTKTHIKVIHVEKQFPFVIICDPKNGVSCYNEATIGRIGDAKLKKGDLIRTKDLKYAERLWHYSIKEWKIINETFQEYSAIHKL